MLNKRVFFAAPLLAVFMLVYLTPAQAAPQLKFAVVDLQKALASSNAGKKAQKQYEAEVKAAQAGLDDKKNELASMKKSLEKQRSSLNEKALAEKEEEIVSTERDLQRSFQDAKEKLQRKNGVLVNDLVRDMRAVVAEVGKDEGYTVVLEKNSPGVLYTEEELDITDNVVEKFNDKRK